MGRQGHPGLIDLALAALDITLQLTRRGLIDRQHLACSEHGLSPRGRVSVQTDRRACEAFAKQL